MSDQEEEDEKSGTSGGLNLEEFKEAMRKTIDKDIGVRHTEKLFMQVDVYCKGQVDWDEYLTYMLLAKKNKEIMEQAAKETPLPTNITKLKSFHKNAIDKICFMSNSRRNIDLNHGHYITMGKDGGVNIWTIDLELISCHKLQPFHRKASRNLWLTGVETISNHNMLAVSTVEGDVFFVDIAVGKFDTTYVLTGFSHPILNIHYCSQVDESYMVLGDSDGNVIYLMFKFSPDGLFGILADKEELTTRIQLSDVINDKLPHVKARIFRKLHNDWVKQVAYIPDLNGFLSCCLSSETSLVAVNPVKGQTFYKLCWPNGFTCFDYDTTQQIIATGGIDGAVRIWNIYTTKVPLMVLRSEHNPISHLVCIPLMEQVISLSKDKSIKVWNLREQSCQQEITASELESAAPSFTSIFFNNRRQHLILGGQNIFLLHQKQASGSVDSDGGSGQQEAQAHGESELTAAIYNSTFDLIVTGCRDSVISVWQVSSGQRVMQFTEVHTTILSAQPISVPITSMRFDKTGRRLITGGQNGQVKFWNFNNGECLRTVVTKERQAVMAVALTKLFVLASTGNTCRVEVFPEEAADSQVIQWPREHTAPAITIDAQDPSTVVTAGEDGQIIIWNLQTGHLHRKLFVVGETKMNIQNRNNSSQSPDCDEQEKVDKETSINVDDHSEKTDIKAGNHNEKTVANKYETQSIIPSGIENHFGGQKQQSDPGTNLIKSEAQPDYTSTDNRKTHRYSLRDLHSNHLKSNTKNIGAVSRTKPSLTVNKVILLKTRKTSSETVKLLAACSRGFIHGWSLHYQGGLLHRFRAVDSNLLSHGVQCMVTDESNTYLATADSEGFVKLWLLQNYFNENCLGVDWNHHFEKFPYLSFPLHNRTPHQPNERYAPRVLTCFRGHLAPVISVDISVERFILVTASTDYSVRVWSLCGRLVGTLGQHKPWSVSEPAVNAHYLERRLPHDVRRTASSTTLKVWNGGRHPRWTAVCRALLVRAKRLRQEMSEEQERARHLNRTASAESDASIQVDPCDYLVTSAEESEIEEQEKNTDVSAPIKQSNKSPILGNHFWTKCPHIPVKHYPHARFVRGQAMVYSLLSTAKEDEIPAFEIPPLLIPLYEKHSDKFKSAKKKMLKR